MEATVDDTVTITRSRYESLERSERWQIAHEVAGVDNWVGQEYINWDYVDTGEGEAVID